MKFRREFSITRLALTLAFAALLFRAAFSYSRRDALVTIAIFAVGAPLNFWFQYWEILPDSVSFRNFPLSTVFKMTDVTYVGPPDDSIMIATGNPGKWIYVRTNKGERMIVVCSNPLGFIAEMKKYVPRVVHDVTG
jgi:hypothetical protein